MLFAVHVTPILHIFHRVYRDGNEPFRDRRSREETYPRRCCCIKQELESQWNMSLSYSLHWLDMGLSSYRESQPLATAGWDGGISHSMDTI